MRIICTAWQIVNAFVKASSISVAKINIKVDRGLFIKQIIERCFRLDVVLIHPCLALFNSDQSLAQP